MLQPTDVIAIITHIRIRRTIVHNTDLHLCPGITFRGVQVDGGYELMLRKAPMRTVAKVMVKTVISASGRTNTNTVMIACAKCLRSVPRLFVDWDSLTGQCRRCVGYNPKVHDIPKRYGNRLIDDYDDDARYRRLMRKKLYADILNFEIAACRASTPVEFFTTRPYLLPEFILTLRNIEPQLYSRLLYELRRKYMYALRSKKVKGLKAGEKDWLDKQIEIRMLNGTRLSKKETAWLEKRLALVRPSNPNCFLGPSVQVSKTVEMLRGGSQHGLKPGLSNSQHMGTGFSSLKTSSDQGTNVDNAQVQVSTNANNAAALGHTPEKAEPSSAPSAKDKAL